MKRFLRLPALALASAACKKDDAIGADDEDGHLTGTVQVRSSVNHTFTVDQSGQVSVTLTPWTIAMGLPSNPANGACGRPSGATDDRSRCHGAAHGRRQSRHAVRGDLDVGNQTGGGHLHRDRHSSVTIADQELTSLAASHDITHRHDRRRVRRGRHGAGPFRPCR
jgi:hypothetical protein